MANDELNPERTFDQNQISIKNQKPRSSFREFNHLILWVDKNEMLWKNYQFIFIVSNFPISIFISFYILHSLKRQLNFDEPKIGIKQQIFINNKKNEKIIFLQIIKIFKVNEI